MPLYSLTLKLADYFSCHIYTDNAVGGGGGGGGSHKIFETVKN